MGIEVSKGRMVRLGFKIISQALPLKENVSGILMPMRYMQADFQLLMPTPKTTTFCLLDTQNI